jgi:hypothetical protein
MVSGVVMWYGPAIALLALLAPRGAATPRPPPPPAARAIAEVRIELERPRARAGEGRAVTVHIGDPERNPVDGDVTLDCDHGQLGAIERVAEGQYRAALAVPQVLPSSRSLLLLARVGELFSERIVPLVPGPAASLEVSSPRSAPGDGASRVDLDVTVVDAFGNAADDEPRAGARLGAVRPAARVGPGRWAIDYRPPRVLEDAEDVLTIEAGTLGTTRAIRIEARATWAGLGPWSGAAASAGSIRLALGAGASWWWRARREQLGVLLDAGWWSLSERTQVALPDGSAELAGDRSYLPLTASFAWGRRLGRNALGWISLGGGGARVSSSNALAGQPEVAEAGWAPAAAASVASGVRAWRGFPYVELRALWIGDPGLLTVAGSAQAILFLAGYRFDAR